MQAKSMIDKYPGVSHLDRAVLSSIMREIGAGSTPDVIKNKYKLNDGQFAQLRSYHNEMTGTGSKENLELKLSKPIELQAFKAKTGAKKQGLNETCLCGSGKKYGNCCYVR
jgi:hypothetical protein